MPPDTLISAKMRLAAGLRLPPLKELHSASQTTSYDYILMFLLS